MTIYSFIQKYFELKLSYQKSNQTVLVMHQINDDLSVCNDNHCFLTLKSFKILIDQLEQSEVEFGNLDKLDNVENQTGKKICYITFDDAYEDVYYNCYPILRAKKIPFSIFVSSSFLNKEKYLNKEMINEMFQSGLCTVGSHAINHVLLRKQTAAVAKYEIADSKNILESILKVNIKLFAYPYGSVYACSPKNIKTASDSGYIAAFSTLNANLPKNIEKHRYFLPRMNVNENNYSLVVSRV